MPNRTRTSLVLACLLLAGAGASTGQTVTAGRGDLPLTVPSSYTADTPAPLIVLLHTYGRTGKIQDDYMGLSALADAYGFIMVAPDGTPSQAANNPLFWNASSACCNWEGQELDDSTYLLHLIEAVKADYAIDPKRVFVVGHSNGAFMAHRLAHDHSEVIAAIVSIAGADQSETRPTPSSPVHVLQIHGDADTAIAYEGGEIRGNSYPSANQTVMNWATRNGCTTTGTHSGTLDLDTSLASMESTVTRYTSACLPGGSAELWTIAGGAHIPELSDHFTRLVVEWVLGHPKP
jgi:polyhydroxybutyrate depolymerase